MLFYLPAIRGGTDAAGYKPHDVCVSKLEFNIVQGCTMLNGWHMMANLKSSKRILSSPVDKYSVNEYIETLNALAFY